MSTDVKADEKAIMFSAPMVREILAGRKTSTRRIVKPQPPKGQTVAPCHWSRTGWAYAFDDKRHGCTCRPVRGYGFQGTQLWVRETWEVVSAWEDHKTKTYSARCVYKADCDDRYQAPQIARPITRLKFLDLDVIRFEKSKWRSGRFMPRWASRITLEITNIRVHRLKDMTLSDLNSEGFGCDSPLAQSEELGGYDEGFAWFEFMSRWDKLNGKGSWESNPLVWAIEFKRVDLPKPSTN